MSEQEKAVMQAFGVDALKAWFELGNVIWSCSPDYRELNKSIPHPELRHMWETGVKVLMIFNANLDVEPTGTTVSVLHS